MEDSDWTIPEDVKTELMKKATEKSMIEAGVKKPESVMKGGLTNGN